MVAVTAGCAGLPGSPASRLKPTASASGKPAKPAALSSAARRAAVQEKLLTVAKVAYTNAQVGIVSNNGGTANAFKAAGVISNNGGNIISNNGGSVISNNGGNVGAGGGAPYPVAATAVVRTVNGAIAPGETLGRYVRWLNGVHVKAFNRGPEVMREVSYDAAGKALGEKLATTVARWPNGLVKDSQTTETKLTEQGEFSSYWSFRDGYAESGELVRTAFDRAVVEDPAMDLYMEAESLLIDTASGKGSFEFVYPKLKLRVKGTLHGVKSDETNRIHVDFGDPLAFYGGVSEVETLDGVPVYTRTHTLTPQPPTALGTLPPLIDTRYDLLNGLSLQMRYNAEAQQFEGAVMQDETIAGSVVMRQSRSGGVSFRVVLNDATAPLVIGYGDNPWPEETPFGPEPVGPSPAGTATPSPSPTPSFAPTPTPSLPWKAEGLYWYVATLAGSNVPGWQDGIDIGRQALNQPAGVVMTSSGGKGEALTADVLIADNQNHRIRRARRSGGQNQLETFAGDGEAGHRDGPVAQARFNGPEGLALGPDGTLYVAEREGHRIRKISPQGVVSTLAGDGTAGFADGTGSAARFARPNALAVDATGTVYVSDVDNHRVRKISPQGVVTTLAGTGTAGFADGPGATAQFGAVTGLVFMPDGALLVADPLNRRIRRITANGVVSTFAGSGESATRDGRALEAAFVLPYGLARDRAGNVYVTDTGASRIRRISAGGEVHTLAGGGVVGSPGASDGLMHLALFNEPSGIAVDADGTHVIVADRSNHRVRSLTNDTIW
jgi:sugar lactone lactonase YvrE